MKLHDCHDSLMLRRVSLVAVYCSYFWFSSQNDSTSHPSAYNYCQPNPSCNFVNYRKTGCNLHGFTLSLYKALLD